MNFNLFYSLTNRISVIELYFGHNLTKNAINIELKVDLFISSHRFCIVDKHISGNEILCKFFCEFKSLEDCENERKSPQTLQFKFKSYKIFSLRIYKIRVYQFEDDCGIPDSPLHANVAFE